MLFIKKPSLKRTFNANKYWTYDIPNASNLITIRKGYSTDLVNVMVGFPHKKLQQIQKKKNHNIY